MTTACAFFVTRLKDNAQYRVVESRPVDKSAGLLCDQIIRLAVATSAKDYPANLRRVKYRDPDTQEVYEFLANNMELVAVVITQLLQTTVAGRTHFQVDSNWHLPDQVFPNDGKRMLHIEVWTAITTYCLLAIARKRVPWDGEQRYSRKSAREIEPRLHFICSIPYSSRCFRRNPCEIKPLMKGDQFGLFKYPDSSLRI